jgi:hypothetical protein
MANTPNDQQTEVTVEDLLRLKRAERPSEEFWGEFDRGLHQRMLQTLVKKAPWYEQVMLGLTGRFARSSAIAAAAVLVALLLVRPSFLSSAPAGQSVANRAAAMPDVAAPVVAVAISDLSYADVASHANASYYGIEVISGADSSPEAGFERDFGMDSMQVASYDSVSYSAGSAHSLVSFASAGVASLVY